MRVAVKNDRDFGLNASRNGLAVVGGGTDR